MESLTLSDQGLLIINFNGNKMAMVPVKSGHLSDLLKKRAKTIVHDYLYEMDSESSMMHATDKYLLSVN